MKIAILIFWLVCAIAAAGLITDPAALWLKIIAVMLLIAHAIEFCLFQNEIKRKGVSGLKAFLMTMLFGLFYFRF
ncbi:MAG: hypothetical protein ACJA2E_000173 [Arenicella sp.]|jgi:uncharacterized protein YhhL (DUF1145 family)